MKITVCDRCGCVIKGDSSVLISIDDTLIMKDENTIIEKEICQECYKVVLAAIKPVSKIDLPTIKTLEQRVETLGLSVRSTNILRRSGIKTIGELIKLTRYDLELMRGMGPKGLDEIETMIDEIKKELESE